MGDLGDILSPIEIVPVDDVELFKDFWDECVDQNWMNVPIETELVNGIPQSTPYHDDGVDNVSSNNSFGLTSNEDDESLDSRANHARQESSENVDPVERHSSGLKRKDGSIDADSIEEYKSNVKIGDSKKHTGFQRKVKKFKANESIMSPCLLKVCQLPIALCNSLNIGDASSIRRIIDTFVQDEVSINVLCWHHPNSIHRQKGAKAFADIWIRILDDNPDMVIDLKEIRLKKIVEHNQIMKQCVIYRVDLEVTRYGPDLVGLGQLSGQEEGKNENDTPMTFCDILELSRGEAISATERMRSQELYKKAKEKMENDEHLALLVNIVMSVHMYFDMDPSIAALPCPLNGISSDQRHRCVTETYQDSKVINITESPLRV